MSSKELTEEEIRIIMENPYILNVSRNKFMLTKEGKEKVLILAESGKTIRQIMIELGYDPQMLGHREFETHGPKIVLLTDITYNGFQDGFVYLSTISLINPFYS